MADLFYPQLETGAVAHRPVYKRIGTRTVANILPSGDLLVYPDDAAQKTTWSWEYVGITMDEAAALQGFFLACGGPLKPFTFLDPLGNLLSASSKFRMAVWQVSSGVAITTDLPGLLPNVTGVRLVNYAQATQEVLQNLKIPADYSYCFSVYLSSATPDSLTLFLRSSHSEKTVPVTVTSEWQRFWISGNLQDATTGLSVGLKLLPGQQVSISAAQLEPHPGYSPYRNGRKEGDIYTNAHWLTEELSVRFVGPNSCSLGVSIEG